MTAGLDELFQVVTTLVTETGQYIKDSIKFIVSNFRYDNPKHLFALGMVLFFVVVIFLSLFLASPSRSISVGSGMILSGTGADGSLFEGAEGGGSGGGSSDLDGDLLLDGDDPDLDGDGIPNNEDFDADGDNSPNDVDSSPCGPYLSASDCNVPGFCGNNNCDAFKTPAAWVELAYTFGGCSDRNLWYNIPDYCRAGLSLYTVYDPNNNTYYYNAVCGTANARSLLSHRCILDEVNHSIYYVETSDLCSLDCEPQDCMASLYCYSDSDCDWTIPMTCADENGTEYGCYITAYPRCCPEGTTWAHYCTLGLSYCSGTDETWPEESLSYRDFLLGDEYSVAELLSGVPYHCGCTSNASCMSDYGGLTCCGAGSAHEGFCYPSDEC